MKGWQVGSADGGSDVQIEDIEDEDVPSKFSIYENRANNKTVEKKPVMDFPPVKRESVGVRKLAHSDDEYSGSNQDSVNEAIRIPPDFSNLQQRMGTDGEIEIDQDFDDENVEIIHPQVF